MAKYDYAYKKNVVQAYINDAGDYQTLANHFDIASISNIRKWVKTFRKLDLTHFIEGKLMNTTLPNDALVLGLGARTL